MSYVITPAQLRQRGHEHLHRNHPLSYRYDDLIYPEIRQGEPLSDPLLRLLFGECYLVETCTYLLPLDIIEYEGTLWIVPKHERFGDSVLFAPERTVAMLIDRAKWLIVTEQGILSPKYFDMGSRGESDSRLEEVFLRIGAVDRDKSVTVTHLPISPEKTDGQIIEPASDTDQA